MKSLDPIKDVWSLIPCDEKSVLEMRCIWPKGLASNKVPTNLIFRGADYESVSGLQTAFEKAALQWNKLGYNIYTVMNPIDDAFAGTAVKDSDILFRSLLLIDIDRSGNTNVPANAAELAAAKQLADAVEAFLHARGCSAPIRVMSGNGYHLYYDLQNVLNDAESKQQIQQFLKNLAANFDNEIVKIDTSVFNASRITKVPGTIARKGVESNDRPYRMAVVL
jgi:hypothetical protein